jgi:hypothetical protein
MSEGEVVEILVTQTSILLNGVGVFFTVISVYLAGLNYFLSEESTLTRIIAFVFLSIALALLTAVMVGAQAQHDGLIFRLLEIEAAGDLTAAGRAAIANYHAGIKLNNGSIITIDSAVVYFIWASIGVSYLSLIYLTFIYRWLPRTLPRGLSL